MSIKLLALVAVSFFVLAPARAAIVIGGTRIVFPAASRDVSLKIQNKGSDPALVQAWIDDGDVTSTPTTAKAPFAITPPVFRIDPAQGHSLRIVHVGDTPASGRETVYWLNVLEIPPKSAEAAGKNVLQLAFRHRIKLFHRPADLSGSSDKAPSTLRWSVEREGARTQVRVDNPSPYYVSFNAVSLPATKPGEAPLSLGGGMVDPGGYARFPVAEGQGRRRIDAVAFVTINDYGATVPGSAAIAE
ncbi:chaperone protein EcpD [Luteibacter sp. UNCMF331Sha3.1]|uniref:fimbrial biogenesis chaperone n=1 Tax=Luteibacter sp. UNCMF331Sha3.1 TaxID=1502760 RepID=UPI0008BD99C0|nr:fimbria/pilus periplasmic chaperone [Luteibacter sp. UNCMF331Sha3.1]SEM37427.1 chaperone protein EcpD [Luteibacter sp. UNCMF331Sha3.1]